MHFQEIFKDSLLRLPKTIPLKKTYRTLIKEMFNNYLGLFEQVEEKAVKIRGLKEERQVKAIISVQQKFIDGLCESLDFYFDGQPAKAYEKFRRTMDNRVKSFKTLQNIREYSKGESFYRIRTKEENYPFTAGEMFHIPFHLRGKVTTQRYSIPGFPSLYLSKAIFVAWEELKRPNLDRFQVVRLESIDPISCLDLTKPEWGNDPMQIAAYRYLIIWPLIAACSIRVANPTDSFKPEYIIPQMLLQWIRNNGEIDGIMYASTNINLKVGKTLKNLYNVVLPVKDNKDHGLCSVLVKKFQMTPAVSRQLLHASSNAGFIIRSRAENQRIDDKIPVLEIIKGQKSYYSASELGKLEMILDQMKADSIDPEC